MTIKTYTAINPLGREVRINVTDKTERQNFKNKGFVFVGKSKKKTEPTNSDNKAK